MSHHCVSVWVSYTCFKHVKCRKGSLKLTFLVTLGILAKFPCKLILNSKLLSNFPPFCWVDLMHWVIDLIILIYCT